MARIPEQEIERLKQEVSLQRLVERYGVELKPHGADLHGLCPFHDDKEPSLVVSPAKNLWHCLGACQAGGTVIDWVMKAEAVSFRCAVQLLREDLPHSPTTVRVLKRSTVRKMPVPFDRQAEDDEVLQRVIDFYHETLKQSPEALGYLESRGLRHAEAVERFKLGFSNRSLGYRLPEKNRKAGAEVRGRLQRLGVLRSTGHEHFNGSLVMPIFDESERVVEVYGRKITPSLRAGTPDHLYLPGPHRGVWNVQALAVSEEIILCEALIDALTFWCAGFRNVTTSYGVEGFTKDHLEAFKRHGTKRVLIAYDRDDAGDKAAASLAEKLMHEGLECFRVQFPRGMDANEYACKVQPASRSLELAIRQALWLGKGSAPTRTVGAADENVEAESPMTIEAAEGAAQVPPRALDRPRSWHGNHQGETVAADESVVDAEAIAVDTEADKPTHVAIAVAAQEVSPLAAHDDSSLTPTAPMEATETTSPRASGLDEADDREPITVSPVPAATPPQIAAEVEGDEVRIALGDRRWRVRGLARNLSFEQLKVNVLVSRRDAHGASVFFVDSLDLYSARQRGLYVAQAAEELAVEPGVIKRDLGKVLLKLEELQQRAVEKTLAPKDERPPMGEAQRAAALALLQDTHLLERILGDFQRCGVVGEQTNKLVGYLAAVSRKLEEPLAVVIQSSSAAGKTSLMEAILGFFPDEERVKYSAMTGQSLFYMGERDLAHKVLAIVEEEGAERASYALKLLQSERELTIASTGKDPQTGRLVTHEYRVEGPVAIFLTTTAAEIDEELLNRCIVLTVDEEREQTRAIHRSQRSQQTLRGLLARRERETLFEVHKNAQRLLRPLLVANPFAEQLTFVDSRTRTRRDHMKYLTLIRTIALLHQYQRPVKTVEHQGERVPYIEVTLEDIAVANGLSHEVLGRSLDELAPQTRRLLELLDEMVRAACERLDMERSDYRFTRREVREHAGWGATQVRVHLERLVELEYVLVHHGGRGQQFVYELLCDGAGCVEAAHLDGLADVEALRGREATTSNLAASRGDLAGGWRGQNGAKTGTWRGGKIDEKAKPIEELRPAEHEPDGNAHLEAPRAARSYTLHRRSRSEAAVAAAEPR